MTYAMTYAITYTLYQSTLSKHFIKALCTSTLHKHLIKTLYQSTLSKHFIQALYQSTLSKHFIKVFLKHFRHTCQGITNVLRQGNKIRYYDKIVNNSLSNIFVQLTCRGEVLRSIICSHYWRRREPPGLLRGGDSRCSF